MGGVQSLSRSTYSKFLPNTNDHASYFSFYDVLEKLGMTIGILSFGYLTGAFNIRYSIMALTVFFVVGLLLLLMVPKENYKSKIIFNSSFSKKCLSSNFLSFTLFITNRKLLFISFIFVN